MITRVCRALLTVFSVHSHDHTIMNVTSHRFHVIERCCYTKQQALADLIKGIDHVIMDAHYGSRPLPRVSKALGEDPKTLGEGQPGKRLMGKRPSPSAKYRALGEAFPECLANLRRRSNAVYQIFFTLPRVQHSGKKVPFFKTSSPSHNRKRVLRQQR
jgi:hypothetical protein